ncbi:hypothetical protein B9Z19DRAFT_1118045 [Tuber borchii]|uniref:Uncharacterized protein n=1 Tax=Tuber borchii TaxID=42251 RepID=A0A2T7A8Z8_TUBBO|nr:hypothetical protein B9Z19DRAFT_1118045 [Tuber borchii]
MTTASVVTVAVASDGFFEYRQSPEGALVFGRILGIARVVDGEIYQARVRARRRGEFARDLFFNGRGGEEEDRGSGEDGDDNDGGFVEHFDERDFTGDEVRLGSIGGGYYAGESDSEDMSIAQGLECGICMRREISVQLRECSHPLAEVKEVGKLGTRVPGFGNACRHGERRFHGVEMGRVKAMGFGRRLVNASFTNGRDSQGL